MTTIIAMIILLMYNNNDIYKYVYVYVYTLITIVAIFLRFGNLLDCLCIHTQN
jgi:hypothetical protein